MVGKIRNIADVSRPDLAYPASQLGRYLRNNDEQHIHGCSTTIPPPPHQQYIYPHPLYYNLPPQTPQTPPPSKQVRPQLPITAQNYYIDAQHGTNDDSGHAKTKMTNYGFRGITTSHTNSIIHTQHNTYTPFKQSTQHLLTPIMATQQSIMNTID
eukprot:Pgem_evm1s2779